MEYAAINFMSRLANRMTNAKITAAIVRSFSTVNFIFIFMIRPPSFKEVGCPKSCFPNINEQFKRSNKTLRTAYELMHNESS